MQQSKVRHYFVRKGSYVAGANKNDSGFTIIEVLIVLAIAGLILIIVFLAVPALQRNSRNTRYKTEARRLLSSSSEQINNNNLGSPAVSVSTTANSDAAKILALANTKDITAFNIEAYSASSPTASLTTATLRLVSKCNGSAPQSGAGRQLALFFSIEDATGSPQLQCVDL